MICEIITFNVKVEKEKEFEEAIMAIVGKKEKLPSIKHIRLVKRTYREIDFSSMNRGDSPQRLQRYVGRIVYILCLEIENEEQCGLILKKATDKYYNMLSKYLTGLPKVTLGEEIFFRD